MEEGALLDTATTWVGQAHHIAVLTGAGISAESGVPTFREAQTGYWARFRPEDMQPKRAFVPTPGAYGTGTSTGVACWLPRIPMPDMWRWRSSSSSTPGASR